eukprot:10430818-Alexandrium_andersonii.AAC.1
MAASASRARSSRQVQRAARRGTLAHRRRCSAGACRSSAYLRLSAHGQRGHLPQRRRPFDKLSAMKRRPSVTREWMRRSTSWLRHLSPRLPPS